MLAVASIFFSLMLEKHISLRLIMGGCLTEPAAIPPQGAPVPWVTLGATWGSCCVSSVLGVTASSRAVSTGSVCLAGAGCRAV